jgi:hypothetical protein
MAGVNKLGRRIADLRIRAEKIELKIDPEILRIEIARNQLQDMVSRNDFPAGYFSAVETRSAFFTGEM